MKIIVVIAWIISGYTFIMLLLTNEGKSIILNTKSMVTEIIKYGIEDKEDLAEFAFVLAVFIFLLGSIILSVYGILNWSSL